MVSIWLKVHRCKWWMLPANPGMSGCQRPVFTHQILVLSGPLQRSFLDDVAGAGGGAETLFPPLLFFSNIFVTICMNHFV